jgi:type IV pilus assembly protein PilA
MLARLTQATKKKDKGFTLIELLVVIIIIGILAAIAIPIFLNQRKKGVDASIKSDVKGLATQIETYYTDEQAYPTALTQTNPGDDITVGTEKSTVSKGNKLTYSINTTTGYYIICGSNLAASATGSGTNFWKYDSGNGGLMPDKVACP